jgi:hypothetical protein
MKFIKLNAKRNYNSSEYQDILLNVEHIVSVTKLGEDQIIIGTENEYNYFVADLTLSEFIDRLKKIQQNINENIFIDFAK